MGVGAKKVPSSHPGQVDFLAGKVKTNRQWSQGPVSLKSRFGSKNLFCVRRVCIHDQSLNNFENNTTKLSVSKAKLTGL